MSVVPDTFDQVMIRSEEELEYLQYVRQAAADKIAPRAEEFDRTGEFPWVNFDVLNSLGLNSVFLPKEHGGTPLSFSCILRIV